MSSKEWLEPGDVPRIRVTVRDENGLPSDPGGLKLAVNTPGGVGDVVWEYGVDGQIIKETSGVFYADFPLETDGEHKWGWESTGVNAGYREGSFMVYPRTVTGL